MTTHADKTYARITGSPAPRDLEWTEFISFWQDRADQVEQETGDRLAVKLNGHREVFRRQHDGRVSIEDIERARHLLAATPEPKGHGDLLAVAIDAEHARIFDFDLDARTVSDSEHTVADEDRRAHHLRTVERHTGHDDERDLNHFFDAVAEALRSTAPERSFVVIGHGSGKADVAAEFVERLRAAQADVAARVSALTELDLSAASDADIEAAAQAAVRL